MEPGAALDPAKLDELVRRIVETAAPRRIILFGSAARGEMGPNRRVVRWAEARAEEAPR